VLVKGGGGTCCPGRIRAKARTGLYSLALPEPPMAGCHGANLQICEVTHIDNGVAKARQAWRMLLSIALELRANLAR
jgi:hypothetical protein